MEILANLPNWVFGTGATAGFAGLLYLLLSFSRLSRTDAVDAYSDLYEKTKQRCDELERKLEEERDECDQKIAALRGEIEGLRRQMSQHGLSAARILKGDE